MGQKIRQHSQKVKLTQMYHHYLQLQSSFILHRHVVVHGEGQHVEESGGQFQQNDHKGLHGGIGDIL